MSARPLSESLALGRELLCTGKLAEAERVYEALVQSAPDHGEARYGRGVVALRSCQFERAVTELALAATAAPRVAAAQRWLGEALLALGKPSPAVAALRRALALGGPSGDAQFFLAVALSALGDTADAERALRAARTLDERLVSALCGRTREMRAGGAIELARTVAEHLIRAWPDDSSAWIELGFVHLASNGFDEAERCFARAHELGPDSADARIALGHLCWSRCRAQEAVEWHERALAAAQAHSPAAARARFHLAIAWLGLGRLRDGFAAFEARKELPGYRAARIDVPEWDGGALEGRTILLYAEQGLGDTLQLVRYAPLVAARGARVVLGVPRALATLLERAPGVERVAVSHEDAVRAGVDVQASLMSLPYLFAHDVDTLPRATPYLAADASRVDVWRRRLGDSVQLRVGIVWAGSAGNANDAQRSCALEHFTRLARVPGVQLVSLQKDRREPWPAGFAALDAARELSDFADTAGLVANLDLVVSVDTAACHLAGALARPVWTLVPFCPDWRWMLGRDDSPWYPTMRLFRQPAPGDWSSVFEHVERELATLAAGR
ncbi:MAG: tetratricopeptide repeat protein [Planctomycetota bacterium]